MMDEYLSTFNGRFDGAARGAEPRPRPLSIFGQPITHCNTLRGSRLHSTSVRIASHTTAPFIASFRECHYHDDDVHQHYRERTEEEKGSETPSSIR